MPKWYFWVCVHEISVEVGFYRNLSTSTGRSEQVSVSKFDRQASVAQASIVPLVTLQTFDAPRSMHEAYPALLAPPSLCTACLL
ncbi:hypothetical protein Gotur_029557 [Gossypium turneri]